MIQGIQSLGKPFGIDPKTTQDPQKPLQQKKEPDIGSLLSGKKPMEKLAEDKKPIEDRIQNRLGNLQELGDKNRERLNISA